MDAIRAATTMYRGLIINVIYVITFIVIAYYLYKFFFAGSDLDIMLTSAPAQGETITKDSILTFTGLDDYPKCRIKQGGEFTVSMWMYVRSYSESGRQGLPKPVFYITDSDQPTNHLMIGVLYPNENKMMIRAYTGSSDSYTGTGNSGTYQQLVGGQTPGAFTGGLPQCDIQDVDMQRWINIIVSVNGRIMDVYMDGKLTRSCILPNVIKAGVNGAQSIVMGGFPGEYSKVRYLNYAATPDQIYSIYQDGPYQSKTIFGYIGSLIGINFVYKQNGVEKSI